MGVTVSHSTLAPISLASTLIGFVSFAFTVGTFLTLPRSPTGDLRAKFARIDFAGAFTLVASIFLLLFGLDRGGNLAWRDTTTIASLSGAAGFFALFVLVELRWAREPCAPKRIVTNRTLLASYLANLFSNAAGITLIFSVSLYLQAVQGARAGEAGLILLPTVFGGVAGSLGIGLIMQATGKYYVATVASFALMLFGTVVVALVTGPWRYTLVGLSFGTKPFAHSYKCVCLADACVQVSSRTTWVLGQGSPVPSSRWLQMQDRRTRLSLQPSHTSSVPLGLSLAFPWGRR